MKKLVNHLSILFSESYSNITRASPKYNYGNLCLSDNSLNSIIL